MTLARSVSDPEKPEHVLLKAGFELEESHIKRLRSLKQTSIWIKYPGLDFLDDMLDPELVLKQQRLYSSLKEDFSEVQQVGLNNINYSQYVSIMSDFFHTLLQDKKPSFLIISELQGSSSDIFRHGTAVTSLALLLGIRLEAYLVRKRPSLPPALATDLTSLGLGCLLHDIGKQFLPEQMKNFHMTAQDQGEPLWQQHTEAGFEMIKSGLDPCAGQIILNHHQHFDGSGFPPRKSLAGSREPTIPLQQEEIHIFCRIAALADRFEGFRHLPDGKLAPTIVALKRIRNPGYACWFDPVIYQTFLSSMPAFLPGEQVTLNDGQLMVVTEVNEKYPCRPTVRPINPDAAQTLDQNDLPPTSDINLAHEKNLHVSRIGNFDVTPYLF